jgi:uncharacterized repeat protein (TIGR01451 family)
MRRAAFLGLAGLMILALNPILVSLSAPNRANDGQQPAEGPRLRLHRGSFDARVTGSKVQSADLEAPAPGPYRIIQFQAPISPADRAALEAAGVEVLEYLPDYAYLVRGNSSELSAVASLPDLYAQTPFTLADKLAPALLRAMRRGEKDLGKVRAFGWPQDAGRDTALARDLDRLAVEQPVSADARMILQLAGLESVRWVEPVFEPRILNDQAREIMNVDPVWEKRQLFGSGQVVAVADSGLDTGSLATLSPDFGGRILATHVLSDGGQWDDNHGHGTHVAGSIAGAGVQSGADPEQHDYANSFAGVAPEANLVIQAFEVMTTGAIVGLDPDYYELFAEAYADGARIHSDSWGDITGPITDTAATYGGYPYGSQRTDAFLWDHPDMAIFFAAGNSGKDGTPTPPFGFCADGDGIIDPDSLLAPGTAKNVITVGAGESLRQSGGLSAWPWLLVGFCFATDPIATDVTSDNPSGMAAFSSRGPTDDGRAKPDIIAPGTNIISNRSHHPEETGLWGPYDADYSYSGGTSMATPLTAGAGVLVREWLVRQGWENPSGAAVKAAMLNTTQHVAPGQYYPDTFEIPYTRPNPIAGWGRVDLGFMNARAPYILWLDDHTAGLEPRQTVHYQHNKARPLEVVDSTLPLRVMLAWTDPPASLSATEQLVNDLDLVVTGPGGATYYGNGAAGGDHTNNVEGVVIPNPALGFYEIEVSAHNVPVSSQPYALAVGGPLGHLGAITASKTPSSTAGHVGDTMTYTYRVTNTGTVTVTDLVGVDDRLGSITWTPSRLAPYEVATGTLTYTLRASDLPGPLVNTVRVSGTTTAGTPQTVTAEAAASIEVRNPAALVVTKLADVDTAEISQTISYAYHVTNTGTIAIVDLVGIDDKLGPLTFGSSSLQPGHSTVGTATHTVQFSEWPGPVKNTVHVTATAEFDGPLYATSQASASVNLTGPAAIRVRKMANVPTAGMGETITYTYRVTNSGTVTLASVSGRDDKLGIVAFSSTVLAPNGSMTGILAYTVQETDFPGPITNTVKVSGTAATGYPLTASDSDTIAVRVGDRLSIFLPMVVKMWP